MGRVRGWLRATSRGCVFGASVSDGYSSSYPSLDHPHPVWLIRVVSVCWSLFRPLKSAVLRPGLPQLLQADGQGPPRSYALSACVSERVPISRPHLPVGPTACSAPGTVNRASPSAVVRGPLDRGQPRGPAPPSLRQHSLLPCSVLHVSGKGVCLPSRRRAARPRNSRRSSPLGSFPTRV